MKINEVMKARRRKLDMTQSELAEKLDVSDKTVSRWELGVSYPNIDMLPKIAKVLGVGINELFGAGESESPADVLINERESRDRGKITTLKVMFFLLCAINAACVIAFAIVSVVFNNDFHTLSDKYYMMPVIIPWLLSLAVVITYFAYRINYVAHYKSKFYQDEYRKIDVFYTVVALAVTGFTIQFYVSWYVSIAYYNYMIPFTLTAILVMLMCWLVVRQAGYKFKFLSVLFFVTAATVVFYLAMTIVYTVSGNDVVRITQTADGVIHYSNTMFSPGIAMLMSAATFILTAITFIRNKITID